MVHGMGTADGRRDFRRMHWPLRPRPCRPMAGRDQGHGGAVVAAEVRPSCLGDSFR